MPEIEVTDGDQPGAVELSGADALARSTELVSGRWWGTAFTVAISFVATGVIVPLVARRTILLYGDAAAEDADRVEDRLEIDDDAIAPSTRLTGRLPCPSSDV